MSSHIKELLHDPFLPKGLVDLGGIALGGILSLAEINSHPNLSVAGMVLLGGSVIKLLRDVNRPVGESNS